MSTYDPAIHHRRSIRLKGHDYAGGGVYFVTICAHRNAGDIFAPAPVREMVARVWHKMPQSPAVGASLVGVPALAGAHASAPTEGTHEGRPYVVMPDHFHALVRMRGGHASLGEIIGAFKSLVEHEYIAGVHAGIFARFPGKIWHRNYYERIVRTPEAESNIANYIRMNPWKLVQHGVYDGRPFRMIGNPALLHREKIAMLCSRNAPAETLASATNRARGAGAQHCFLSGFHSPPEKEILAALLQSEARLICCPAWGIDEMRIPAEWLPALEANRMLILEMRDHGGNLDAAEARNRFILETAEKRWIPHATPGGMLHRLVGSTPPSKGTLHGCPAPTGQKETQP